VRHGIKAPLGAVKISKAGKSQVREIKVRMDGVPARRWVRLARYWWERNKGPVPAGHRVIHFDGDCLNDDPHNYALATAGDVIAGWHLDNPSASAKQHRRAARGTKRHNKLRAQINRRTRRLPSRWYGVEIGSDFVRSGPFKSRSDVFRDAGFDVPAGGNGRKGYGLLLGWPEATAAEALLLHALSVEDGSPTPRMCRIAAAAATPRGFDWSNDAGRIATLLYKLRRRGLIRSQRGGRHHSRHFLTDAGRRRGPICLLVARRGDQLPEPSQEPPCTD
jgi:hypothetical protein